MPEDIVHQLTITLRKSLREYFSIDELTELCADLNIYEEFNVQNRSAYAREIVDYLRRRERLEDLVLHLGQKRKNQRLTQEVDALWRKIGAINTKNPPVPLEPNRELMRWLRGLLQHKRIELVVLFGLMVVIFLFSQSANDSSELALLQQTTTRTFPETFTPTSLPTPSPNVTSTHISQESSPEIKLVFTSTAQSTDIPTQTPSSTSLPTSTNAATSTITPMLTSTSVNITLYQVDLAPNQSVNVYTQPSNVTGAPRAQVKGGDIVEKLEQDGNSSWYRVRILKNGIEGWIQANMLVPASETPTPTPSQETPLPPPPPNCLTVNLERETIVNHDFDTITLRYSNWPAGTVDFAFEAYTTPQGGGRAYLVEPTLTDTGTTFYEMAYTRFEDRGFQPYTPFTYALQPRNATGQVLCTASGSFTNP